VEDRIIDDNIDPQDFKAIEALIVKTYNELKDDVV